MKSRVWASALFFALSIPVAAAADLPTNKASPAPLLSPAFAWTGCYAGVNVGALGNSARFSGLNTSVDDRARVGIQAGCNYQFDRWVIGAEGELNEGFWSGQRAGFTQNVALRGGYALDKALIFGKVGVGFIHNGFSLRFPALNLSEYTSQERAGLLLGGGGEYAIDRHWSVKAEFDYLNYGSRNVAFTGAQPRNIDVGTSQIVGDVGVNYHF